MQTIAKHLSRLAVYEGWRRGQSVGLLAKPCAILKWSHLNRSGVSSLSTMEGGIPSWPLYIQMAAG